MLSFFFCLVTSTEEIMFSISMCMVVSWLVGWLVGLSDGSFDFGVLVGVMV